MQKDQYYQLTLHYYPGVIAAGLKPVIRHDYDLSGTSSPGTYKPDIMDFLNRPVRNDMLNVIRSTCRSIWYKEIEEILKTCEFPYLDYAHKSSRTEFFDNGVQIGHIEVEIVKVFSNDYVSIPMVEMAMVEKIVQRLPKNIRDEAYNYVRSIENAIKELYLDARYNMGIEDFEMATAIRIMLRKTGYLKSGPKNIPCKRVKA